jgi:hypothetical protein
MTDPIQSEYYHEMNALAEGIDKIFNGPKLPGVKPKVGFILLTAEFGKIDGGRVNYISNGNREDMLSMLREYLARAEGRYQEADEGKPQ